MKLNSINHVYRYVPNFMDNRKLPKEEQIVFGLKVAPMPEQDAYQNQKALNFNGNFAPDKAQEENDRLLKDLVKSKLAFIENLDIDDKLVTDLETAYREAPPELIAEVFRAVMSTAVLFLGEQKNF